MNKLYYFIAVLLTAIIVHGQIGINTNNPNPNSLLHIESSAEHLKGVLIPRLTQDQINKLTYTESNQIKLTEADNGCDMYWSASEMKWLSQCGNSGNSKFTYSDSDISVHGNYVAGRNLDSSHYLLLEVNVLKKGNYSIVAEPNTENGFSFASQGFFNTIGRQIIKVAAQGKPIALSPQSDTFTIVSSQGVTNPLGSFFSVNVVERIADYNLICSSANVSGRLVTRTPLTRTNKIDILVTVTSLGSYEIFTEEINGIKFVSRGIFTSLGRQQVILVGQGTPMVYDDFDVEIYGNSLTSAVTCNVKISLLLPPMSIGLIGKTVQAANQVTDWSIEGENARYKALSNLNNFSENGTVKIVSLGFEAFGATGVQSDLLNDLTNMLTRESKPDVLIYYSGKIALNSQISTKLAEYVRRGGVLLFGTSDNSTLVDTKDLINKIFGNDYNVLKQREGELSISNTYPIKLDLADPIINGVFGNTSGQHWGEEGSSNQSLIFPSLPPKSVQLVTAYNISGKSAVDINRSIVWYNKDKGFIFFGDSPRSILEPRLNSEEIEKPLSQSSYPSYYYLDEALGVVPKPRTYGPGNPNNRLVFNSILEMNAIAWALRKAANEGINSH